MSQAAVSQSWMILLRHVSVLVKANNQTDSVDTTKQKTYREAQSHGNVDDNNILTPGVQGQDIILEDTVKDVCRGLTQLDVNSNTEGLQHTPLDPDAGLNMKAAQSLISPLLMITLL